MTRLIDMIFHDVKFSLVFNYLDDLLILSDAWKERVEHLEGVLTRLKSAGLTAKVVFAREQIYFLCHLVGGGGVRIDPERTSAIRDFAAPRDVKGVSCFHRDD